MCARSDGLAQELEHRLRECYITKVRDPKDAAFTYSGRPTPDWWHLVLSWLQVAAQELTPGDLRCPVCSRSLVESSFSVGCYCANEAHCSRSQLRALLKEKGAKVEQEVP